MPRWLSSARRHPGILALCSIYALALALILVWPSHPDAGLGGVYAWVLHHVPGLRRWGIDAALNIVLFAPFGAILAGVLPRRPFRVIGLAGATSLLVEIFQGMFLPGRTSSAIDVVANTAGAVLGVIVVGLLRFRRERESAPPTSRAPARPLPPGAGSGSGLPASEGFGSDEVTER